MPSEDHPKPEIVTDEDWKQRIKAEDVALDQKLKEEAAEKQEESPPDQAKSDSEQPDPEADQQGGAQPFGLAPPRCEAQ